MVDVGGVFLAVLSAILNGSFGTLSKIKRVQEAGVHLPNIIIMEVTLRHSKVSVEQDKLSHDVLRHASRGTSEFAWRAILQLYLQTISFSPCL